MSETGRNMKLVSLIGFWAAVLTTAWIVVWIIVTAVNAAIPMHFLVNFTALMIAPPFVILMSSIHAYAPTEKKLWAQIALAFSIIYAVVIGQNYFLQMTVVRQNPEGFAALTMDPGARDSIFWAFEILGYGFMSLATLFVSPVFGKDGIERWIRRLFILNAVAAMIAVVTYVLTANPFHILGLVSVGIWSIAFPIATALLAALFKRAERMVV